MTAAASKPPDGSLIMRTSLTKAELGNDLMFETLRALHNVLSGLGCEVIVVGATARDIAFMLLDEEPSKRKTLDLDIAVALSDWNKFDRLTEALCDNFFEKLQPKQKFAYRGPDNNNDYEVDIVPFGKISDNTNETIPWPPDGTPEMSVRCYNDIMAHAIEISIEDIHFKIAPLAGQFIIKLDAWVDRNDRFDKDAADMMFILSKYFTVMATECTEAWPDEVDFENMDDACIIPAAEWIASDSSKMLSTDHLRYYRDLLIKEHSLEEKSRLLRQLTKDDDDNPDLWETVSKALTRMSEIWDSEIKRRGI